MRSRLPPFCDVNRKSEPSAGRALSQARTAASSSSSGWPRCGTNGWVGEHGALQTRHADRFDPLGPHPTASGRTLPRRAVRGDRRQDHRPIANGAHTGSLEHRQDLLRREIRHRRAVRLTLDCLCGKASGITFVAAPWELTLLWSLGARSVFAAPARPAFLLFLLV